MTREELKQNLMLIESAYPGKNFKVDQDIFNVWYECVGELRASSFHKAVLSAISKNTFPPTIAEIKSEYDTIEAERIKLNNEIRRDFDNAISMYPGMKTDRENQTAWKMYLECLKSVPEEVRVKKADEINKAITRMAGDIDNRKTAYRPMVDYVREITS